MTEHTPGPWMIDDYTDDGLILVYGEHGENVAEIYHDSVGRKSMANARLIAAALALLEACKAALKYELSDDEYENYELQSQLESAIAKVEGES